MRIRIRIRNRNRILNRIRTEILTLKAFQVGDKITKILRDGREDLKTRVDNNQRRQKTLTRRNKLN